MYRLKKTVRPDQRVILKRNFKPYGRTIHLDTANQKQLKHLYDMHNKFIEFVPKEVLKEAVRKEKIPTKKVNTELHGSDKL